MAVKIIWAPRANDDFDGLTDYLLQHVSEKAAMKFIQETFSKLDHIANFPNLYPETSHFPGVRRCVINPHVSLYYRATNENLIELVAFYSNRKNPEDLEL